MSLKITDNDRSWKYRQSRAKVVYVGKREITEEKIVNTPTYNITWCNYDGSILYVDRVAEGTTPTYRHPIPSRESTEEYEYVFTGWDPELVPATEDATYTATYTAETRYYEIVWDIDGELVTQSYEYGDTPVYPGETPTKESTAQYDYTFSGWDPEISSVISDVEYEAVFTETLRSYTIIWLNYDNSILDTETYNYGETPNYTGSTPTRPDSGGYSYTFSGWEPSVEVVVGDQSYTAQYTETPIPQSNAYVTFSSPNSFTLETETPNIQWEGTLEYSTDTTTWTTWDGSEISSGVVTRDTVNKLYLRGSNNTRITGYRSVSQTFINPFVLTGSSISVEGNFENLLDYAVTSTSQHPTKVAYCFHSMFKNCTALVSIAADTLAGIPLVMFCYQDMFRGCTGLTTLPTGLLSTTTLAEYCYGRMFYDCTGLITLPTNLLSATILTNSCYEQMFRGCTSLTSVPNLPATTLADHCYARMFSGCTSLTSIPSNLLPATTLAERCYSEMFSGCTSLTSIPSNLLPATTLADYCYAYMFSGCTNLRRPVELPATTLAERCYSYMFDGCLLMYISDVQSSEYDTSYCIPTSGGGIDASGALADMFSGTSGPWFGTPSINTTYYLREPFYIITWIDYDDSVLATETYIEGQTPVYPNGTPTREASGGYSYTFNGWTPAVVTVTGNATYKATYTATPIVVEEGYVRFKSSSPFTIDFSTLNAEGTIEYSTNNVTWNTYIEGESSITSALDSGYHYIYLRGSNNTVITQDIEVTGIVISGTNVSVSGVLEALLDYQTVLNGGHPTIGRYAFGSLFDGELSIVSIDGLKLTSTTLASHCYSRMFAYSGVTSVPANLFSDTVMAEYCYSEMFYGCSSLTSVSSNLFSSTSSLAPHCFKGMFTSCISLSQIPVDLLPFTTLAVGCYDSMFDNCTSLTSLPVLPALSLVSSCYCNMFIGCTSICLSTTQDSTYVNEYRIPSTGTGTDAGWALTDMFTDTGGTFTGTPTINTTYYTSNTVV